MCHALIRIVCYVCEREISTRTKLIDCLPIVSRPVWGSATSNLEHHRAKRFKQNTLCPECGEWRGSKEFHATDNNHGGEKTKESSPSSDDSGNQSNESNETRSREGKPKMAGGPHCCGEEVESRTSVVKRKILALWCLHGLLNCISTLYIGGFLLHFSRISTANTSHSIQPEFRSRSPEKIVHSVAKVVTLHPVEGKHFA